MDDNSAAQNVSARLQHDTYIQLTHYNKTSYKVDEVV